ncbi:hypothetical protein HWV23_15790 [Natronomonas halophila]|uniref:hypothetical protein n=1 Tax=Natronomonas halophila TaxID=2747817 RepID=UPI0015B5E6B0|nr:hypothetical protein [Natronomonas halophila]QLD87123.1 hypothetical protein HWV23_15790 [Natronomonas halophila]
MVRDRTWMLVATVVLVTLFTLTGGVSAAEHEDEGANFDVEITGTNAPITEGEPLVVNATITNTGDVMDSQQIHLKDDNLEIVDSVEHPPVTLSPNESQNVTLRWQTGEGDAGDTTFSVQSDDDYPRGSATIEEGAFFNISIVETNAPITAGETLEVTVDTTNTGEVAASAQTWLAVDNATVDRDGLHIQPGQTVRTQLTWDSSASHVGVRTLVAEAEGDRVEMPITVEEGGESTSEDASAGGSDGGTDSETTTSETSTTSTPTTETEATTPESLDTDPDTETAAADAEMSTESEGDGSLGVVGTLLALLTIGLLVARRRV